MTRILLFVVLSAALVAYSFWIYLRVELRVPVARALAAARATALVVILLLLFNPHLPFGDGVGAPVRWVLLDASLSMSAASDDGSTPWASASARAADLGADGWSVVHFGGDELRREPEAAEADQVRSRLAPALSAAAEAGARDVIVLSDARFEDGVAVGSALESLPISVTFESFGDSVPNAGIARFEVADLVRIDDTPVAELELFAEGAGDTLDVEILEEGRSVATQRVASPSPGLRANLVLDLPPPTAQGRVRYTARVVGASDGFASDDESVSYANVGFEEGGVVLVSVRPNWEPRHLFPVLREVTGLPTSGYLRAGDDRYLPMGRAVDRGGPVDSATVRAAAAQAAILVVHGLRAAADAWVQDVASGPGSRLVLPGDAAGAAAVGIRSAEPQAGEWYVSPDVPTSPIAGSLSDVAFDALPPLTDVLVASEVTGAVPLELQLRGAGAPQPAFTLIERPAGRMAVSLSSGYWRWAMRPAGREPYRRLWSGIVGWLLADRGMATAEPRPVQWVFERGEAVLWGVPADSSGLRLAVRRGDVAVADTVLEGGGPLSLGAMAPGTYDYSILGTDGDTVGSGRFDVSASTHEMVPRRVVPTIPAQGAGAVDASGLGPPLRTSPWPYLLVILLLCGEWIVRRRIGLR
ncbi:MAG: hypothetical protein OEN56_10805 [Gemmatimonadota bacterium]|nr:hypothetical protein [Gemmatimonadota bacterium]